MKKTFTIWAAILLYITGQAQITSAASGNWNNPATWVGNAVPTSADVVTIASPHVVSLDADGTAKSITVSSGGRLNINTASTLTVGNFNSGGGRDSVIVYGIFNMSNGALNIGGRFRLHTSPATYTQTGGTVRIDGNTGLAGTSVADADFLYESGRNYISGYTFNGGSLVFIDPPFGATGNCMKWPGTMYLNAGCTIQLGDGISTTAGGNAQGFIYNTYVGGDVVVNNPAGTNRGVYCPAAQIDALTVTAGTFNTNSLDVINAAVNSGTITTTGNIDFTSSFTNNATISATNTLYVVDAFTNNAGATATAPTMYLTGDVTNNGTINASTTFGFARTGTTNGNQAQIISGTGTFNTSTATLRLDNSNASGVTLNRSLVVNRLSLGEGKLFLGANDITYSNTSVTGGAAAYIVTNGTGRLRFTNLTTTEVLFPIGTSTSYNPVRINNGSGHTFSVGVQSGFTITPPGTQHVNREWDIDDETGGPVSATVTLQWNAADEDPTFVRGSCAISHYSGGSWKKEGTVGAASGTGPYTKQATGITSFSPFGVSSNLAVLPVRLLSFTGIKHNSSVRLSWRTADESNVSHFEVERSSNERIFDRMATASAQNSAGAYEYSLTDNSPARGANFYRLKIIGVDGRFSYSSTVKIDFAKAFSVHVFPNPAKDFIMVQSDKQPTGIELTDMSGNMVRRFVPTANGRYALQGVSKGMYLVRIVWGGESETLRLFVE